jgi:hypothetical protein
MSDKKIHPEPYQTREKIERMPEKTEEDLIYKNGFRYLYLIAGRISELVGKYAPEGSDAHYKTIKGREAVIFPVKTARHQGGHRPVVLPFSKKYEEWTEPLYEWFSDHEQSNPFDLRNITRANRKHYPRYYQLKAEREVFKDHEWRREEYTRNGKVEKAEKKAFTLMRLRDQRIRELRDRFNFYDEEIRIFVGLSQPRFSRMPRLLTPSPNEPIQKPNYPQLESMASNYFAKLLKEDNS